MLPHHGRCVATYQHGLACGKEVVHIQAVPIRAARHRAPVGCCLAIVLTVEFKEARHLEEPYHNPEQGGSTEQSSDMGIRDLHSTYLKDSWLKETSCPGFLSEVTKI